MSVIDRSVRNNTVRWLLPVDHAHVLEQIWGARFPGAFHFEWADDVTVPQRSQRERMARDGLAERGLIVSDDGQAKCEDHVGHFLDVLSGPDVVVESMAWSGERQVMGHVACDAARGLSLVRGRRGVAASDSAGSDSVWGDEDGVELSFMRRGVVLGEPLRLLDMARDVSHEDVAAAGEPVVMGLAESVGVVNAFRAGSTPANAYTTLDIVGLKHRIEPFLGLAQNIMAGFQVRVSQGLRLSQGMYVRTPSGWVSIAMGAEPVLEEKDSMSAEDLLKTAQVRLAPTTVGQIMADYLACVSDLLDDDGE